MAKPYVDNWLKTRQSVNDIISGFSIFALMTNLSESLQGDGQQLFDRADLFNNLRDNRGLMMLDKDSEDFKNVAAPLGSLDKLQAQAQEHMAAVARIPLVKLLGVTPSGLNASSDGEIRSFYDYIHAYQEHLFRDKLRRLMGLVMLSLWGETDDAIDFEFEPLWALDEKGEAEVRKIEAETGQILIDDGTISPEEERKRVASDPGSGYETIDVLDVPDLEEEEIEGLEPKASAERLAQAGETGETGDDAALAA
jgi:phage-related protein (TIGR01555 family)